MPFPFLEADLQGAAAFVGFGFLVATAGRSRTSLALLTLLGSAYLWWFLSYGLFLLAFPTVPTRAMYLIDMVLAAAAGLGAVEVLRHSPPGCHPVLETARAILAVVVGCAVFATAQQSVDGIPYLDRQQQSEDPTEVLDDFGRRPPGAVTGPSS